MSPQKFQLLEFRGRCIKLSLVQFGQVDLCYEAPVSSKVNLDTSLIEWFQSIDLNLIPLRKLPLFIIVPTAFFAIKIVSIPSQTNDAVDDLLSFEINSVFAHVDGPYIWNRILLERDDVEQTYLLSVLGEQEYLFCKSMFSDRGIPLVRLLPLYLIDFLVFRSVSKTDHSMMTRFIHFDDHRLIFFGSVPPHSCLRSIHLPMSINFENIVERNENFEFFFKEWKRFSATIDRSIGQVEHGDIILCNVNASSCCLIDLLSEDPSLSSLNFRELDSFSEEGGREYFFEQMVISDEIVYFGGTRCHQKTLLNDHWVIACIVLCTLLPIPIIVGNVAVIGQYNREFVRLDQQLKMNQQNRSMVDDLADRILKKINAFDGIVTAVRAQEAWAEFMQSIERAMDGVGDVWLDTFDYSPEKSSLHSHQIVLEGRFLIRQRNLTDLNRELVISRIETKLTDLIDTLVLSELVISVSDLKVNFSGVDRGINVVPFQLRLSVASSLSGRGKGDLQNEPSAS